MESSGDSERVQFDVQQDSPTEVAPLHSVILGPADAGSTVKVPLVFLHGWQRSLEAFRPLGELLADDRKVVLIDLPGFGRSPLPHSASNEGGGWSTLEYAERVRSALLDLNISRCILVGHSFGGRISLRLASGYPELVRGLVLIGSHGLVRDRPPEEALKIAAIRAAVNGAKWIDKTWGTHYFQQYLSPRFGSADYKAAGELRKTLVKTVNENLESETRSITQPTLLLWGEDDKQTPLDLARRFRGLIRGSELHVFANKGHEPYLDVGAHLCASYIERFLLTRCSQC